MTEDCRVYWGSHGCNRERGHRGRHFCECCECPSHRWRRERGCVGTAPYYGWATWFYGEDAPRRDLRRWLARQLYRD